MPAGMDATADDSQFDLIDLNAISLADLRGLDGSAFGQSLRRILDDIDRPQDAVAGWNAAIG
jgi:FXSXX-COOH protein